MTGFEPLIGAATAGLTGLIGNVIKEKGGKLLEQADIDLFQGRELNRAVQRYVQNYADRHGQLKVACVRMDRPMRLDEIYTAVQLLPRSALRYYESTASLQRLFRESGRRGFELHDVEKQQGIEVANAQQYLMVLGGPGVGKSTFLRKMGLEALRRHAIMNFAQQSPESLQPQERYYAHECIPVMLELRQFQANDLNIKDFIASEFEICGFPEPQKFTELMLKSGKLLILLDGLDEVPTEALNAAVTQIENLVDRYSENRFIASCRVAAYTFGGFRRFNDVAMAAFEDEQIERFIQNWFRKPRDLETQTAERCWELLSSPDYQAAKELAQTPLLLTLLCVIYDEFQDFPKKRHQVYGEALDVILRKWAAEKRLQKEPIYQQFGSDLELELLSEIAYTSFVDDQLFFAKADVLDQIRTFQADNENAPNLDAGKILQEIEVQQGILVERAREAYSFSHLTFQEYLTAKSIVDNQKVTQLVSNHLGNQRWREVFLLVAGLVPGKRGADELLLAMEKQAQSKLQSERLQALVKWADAATQGSPGQIKAAAKRTAALALDLDLDRALALDLALDLDRALDRALARALDRALDRARALALDLARALARALDRTRARAHALDRVLDLVEELQPSGVFRKGEIENSVQRLTELKQIIPNNINYIKGYYHFLEPIRKVWENAINLKPDLLQLSEQESQALNDYFYAVELMIRCKEAAVRVSPPVWEGIESRILTAAGTSPLERLVP
ncbi:NACHT domain-containing protein [Sphaerothrix gracilis]|uniref:NACHT domain-containing protein n=1 Tax=Sphaerothrix gracilis TaxID=3151835 RepID=UPI0031FDF0B0